MCDSWAGRRGSTENWKAHTLAEVGSRHAVPTNGCLAEIWAPCPQNWKLEILCKMSQLLIIYN